MWKYNGDVLETIPEDVIGFVYLITNLETDKKYVGKKLFRKSKKLPKTKTRKRVTRVQVESDWKDYFGSSEALKADVALLGEDKFRREILHFCKTKGELSYKELEEQILRRVLFNQDAYYNNYVGCRIHVKHLKLSK